MLEEKLILDMQERKSIKKQQQSPKKSMKSPPGKPPKVMNSI